ncbi:Ger(x)C family spore germination C-terminal domain-containing protein [Paenibacillus sp. GD4]|uniref:Ger(x)C family spore germination C-terminal domain-containing protein n=1 Tax=Paenibacillus sp. GD4 TaxID=3068890 RepID=UPI0027969454|nr:Ger(x)C family spore germination C-terminal domain-containing protein [Paenibacillus sp. GD4]MDQ1914891.1 Ger(x)C family spore germination C-terminal domain-containing protein [Paenibacillus sp. GD4]
MREDWVYPGEAFEKDFIHRAEQATVEAIRNATEKVLSKMQKDLKVDVAGFGKKISIKYPQMWKRMKKDWDRKFSEMQVDVKVNVKIQEFGTKGAKKG